MACRSEGAADVAHTGVEIVASINTDAAKAKIFIMVLTSLCVLPIARCIDGIEDAMIAMTLICACNPPALLNSSFRKAPLRSVLRQIWGGRRSS